MPEPVTSVAAGTSATSGGPRRGRPPQGKAASAVKKAKPTVTDKELVDALSMGLSVALMGYFQFIARIPAEARNELDPTTEEADAFVTPIAKLINRQSMSGAATAIAGGADWMVAAAAAMSYVDRAGPVLRRYRTVKSPPTPTPQPRRENTNGNVRSAHAETPSSVAPGFPGVAYGIGPQATQD